LIRIGSSSALEMNYPELLARSFAVIAQHWCTFEQFNAGG
jgi:hypothetical protein